MNNIENIALNTTDNFPVPVIRIKMIREKGSTYCGERITTPSRAAKMLKELFQDMDREAMFVLCLSSSKQPTGVNLVSVGSISACIVEPREVFKPAILSNAASIVLAHNHPSGNLTASQSDLRITSQINEAGKLMGIALDDHLIFSPEGDWISMVERYPEVFK